MTLGAVQTPTPSIRTVLTHLARHARENPGDDISTIGAALSASRLTLSIDLAAGATVATTSGRRRRRRDMEGFRESYLHAYGRKCGGRLG